MTTPEQINSADSGQSGSNAGLAPGWKRWNGSVSSVASIALNVDLNYWRSWSAISQLGPIGVQPVLTLLLPIKRT